MKVEGKYLKEYIKLSKTHIIILFAWTLAGFFMPLVFQEQQALIAFGSNMVIIAPIFMIFVFGHLGYSIANKTKHNFVSQAVFAGILAGLFSGLLAGILMIYQPVTSSYMINLLFNGSVRPEARIALSLIAGIVTAVLRAVYGAIFCWAGAMIIKVS